MAWRALGGLLAATLAAACTLGPERRTDVQDLRAATVAPFSLNAAGVALPVGWTPWTFGPTKPATDYETRFEAGAGGIVLHAHALRSASALLCPVPGSGGELQSVRWRWRAGGLIDTADLTRASGEDSPVRLFLGFNGDISQLSFRDLLFREQIKLRTGQDMPYATLMYVWDNRLPVGTILSNPHTGRIRMLVVESGAEHVGAWRTYQRDFRADFRAAFNEEPGPLTVVGIMTDTDNTGQEVESDYGDIGLVEGAAAQPPSPAAAH